MITAKLILFRSRCLRDYRKPISSKRGGRLGHGLSKNPLNFGEDLDKDADPGLSLTLMSSLEGACFICLFVCFAAAMRECP